MMDKSKIVTAAIAGSLVGAAAVIAGLIKKKYLVLSFGRFATEFDEEMEETEFDEE